jgi:hypothetical protein
VFTHLALRGFCSDSRIELIHTWMSGGKTGSLVELARDLLEPAFSFVGFLFPSWVVLWIVVSEYAVIRWSTQLEIASAIATAAVLPLISLLPLFVVTTGVLLLCTYPLRSPVSLFAFYSKIFYPDASTYLFLTVLFLLWILIKTLTDALILARILHRPAQERRLWTRLTVNASIFAMAFLSLLFEVAGLPKPIYL